MQLNMFADKRMKILYALSFMHGGIAQVWAKAVNLSGLNTDLSDADLPDTNPRSHPHARHLGAHGHRQKLTQA